MPFSSIFDLRTCRRPGKVYNILAVQVGSGDGLDEKVRTQGKPAKNCTANKIRTPQPIEADQTVHLLKVGNG
jgi:hypothetical protein